MSDITLRVRASFDEAQKAFESLAESSQETREQMEKFAASLTGREVDDFNNRQKRLQASLMGTRGETAALEQSSRNYQREIERLIRSGLSPNSEAVQRLRNEQQQLERRLDASRKAQERKTRAIKTAKTAIKASAVAIAGLATGIVALTKRNANLANEMANSARIVGMTTETFQELNYVMRMSGIENGEYMLNRLNRSVIDARNETGTLTKFLKDNYYQLLEQLQGVENNEEAFTLLMDAINRAPNEFARAELAMAAFGRNGAQMVLVADQSTEGINALREEARQLGLVSNENAQAAIAFNDAMFRLRTAAQGISQELTSQLLPVMTNIVVRVTNAIQRFAELRARVQSLRSTFRDIYPHIISVTAGVATFIGVMKGTKYITAMITAIRNLKLMTKALTTYKTIAKAVKAGFLALSGVGLIKLAGAALAAGGAIAAINIAIRNARDSAEEFDATINNMDLPAFNYMAEDIADLDVALTELAWGGAREAAEAIEEVNDAVGKSLKQRLNLIEYTANQEKNININTIEAFLIRRAQLESEDWEKQKAFLKEKQEYLLTSYTLVGDERIAVEQAVQNAIQALQEKTVEASKSSANNMLKAYSSFFGGFSKLLGAAGRENRAFFMASRSMALVQAGINTALAITKTLSTTPWPLNIPKAIGVGLKGAAQKAKIASSMIPSAETGGRFIVPQSRGVDSNLMRVNSGEEVSITPRGMANAGETSQYIFKISEQVVFDIVNRGGRSGDIHVFEPAANY